MCLTYILFYLNLNSMRWTNEAIVNGLTISKCWILASSPKFTQGPGPSLLHCHSFLTSFLVGPQVRESYKFSKTLSCLIAVGHHFYHFSFYLYPMTLFTAPAQSQNIF